MFHFEVRYEMWLPSYFLSPAVVINRTYRIRYLLVAPRSQDAAQNQFNVGSPNAFTQTWSKNSPHPRPRNHRLRWHQ